MVEDINFEIPPGDDLDNPVDDPALMARIGAKRKIPSHEFHDELFGPKYELKNAVTGTRFTFAWQPERNGYDMNSPSKWRLERMK